MVPCIVHTMNLLGGSRLLGCPVALQAFQISVCQAGSFHIATNSGSLHGIEGEAKLAENTTGSQKNLKYRSEPQIATSPHSFGDVRLPSRLVSNHRPRPYYRHEINCLLYQLYYYRQKSTPPKLTLIQQCSII